MSSERRGWRAPPPAWPFAVAASATSVVAVMPEVRGGRELVKVEVHRARERTATELSGPWTEEELRPSGFFAVDAEVALDLAAAICNLALGGY